MSITRSRAAVFTVVRCLPLVAALVAMFVVNEMGFRGLHTHLAQAALVLLAAGAAALAVGNSGFARINQQAATVLPLSILALDIALVGVVGTWLHVPEVLSLPPRPSLPFVTGYLVALVVAVAGRRPGMTALGVLTGAMLLLMAEGGIVSIGKPLAVSAQAGAEVVLDDPSGPWGQRDVFLAFRMLLLAAVAFECSTVLGWIDAEGRRRRAAETVERELRAREVIASEMAVFNDEAARADDIGDLAEAVLVHLRRHFPTSARGLFLEEAGERVAIWEEPGAALERVAEQRRLRLQEAVREAGSNALVPRLEVRATGVAARGAVEKLRTGVGVPVHATGRVGGVVYVGDEDRDALPAERLGALAELGRQVGDALRRIERSRDEQTRRTSLLLGQMREGVLLLGADGRVAMSNPAGRRLLAALGVAADGPVAVGELDTAGLASVPAGGVRRTTAAGNDGEGRTVRVAVAATGVVDGTRRLGTLLTLTDVTDEEQARARLMQAEKMSVVGQTLASVAHELNNPLAAIVGYADILAEEEVPPETAKLLGRIREQATRTSRIVKNLLNVARRRGPERTRISLNEVVASVTDLFAYDARMHEITLVPVLAPDLPQVLADRSALQQVLVNLVQNGIQALRGRGKASRIEIRTRADRAHVYLEVADDGPGVPPPLRAKIFEAFFTTKGPGEGTGLGLAISRTIAREHGGDLVLEDRAPNTGAQFTLRLPLETAHAETPAAPDRVIPEGVPARVLVVDDEAPVRDSLVKTLHRLGAQVDGIGAPGEAERHLDGDTAYDAILLDVRMPGRTGLDLHRSITAKHPELARRVVFMTGDLVNDDVLQAVRATGSPLLEKPFTADELRVALAELTPG
ncbi:MAG: ATP-binding protein [Planctomycetota bacterium]